MVRGGHRYFEQWQRFSLKALGFKIESATSDSAAAFRLPERARGRNKEN
jgi:hypothetical protein